MKLMSTLILALVLLVAAAPAAQDANTLFQQALVKERTEGNLPEAIKLYQRIVDNYASDRKVAAQALLQLAGCQSKLGDVQARASLERLVRDFGEQKETVAEARVQLVALQDAAKPSPTGPVDQLVWAVPAGRKLAAGPTRDGRYVLYGNASHTVLWLHDLRTGTDRTLLDLESQQDSGVWSSSVNPEFSPDGTSVAYLRARNRLNENVEQNELWIVDVATGRNRKLVGADAKIGMGVIMCAFSPDSRQIAYEWDGTQDAELRLVNVDGTNPRVLNSSRNLATEPGHHRVFVDGDPTAWSPDGKTILAYAWRWNGDVAAYMKSRVSALISVAHDTAQVLSKELGPVFAFSPDGKYLFCKPKTAGVSILPVAGGGPIPLFGDPAAVTDWGARWAPDGRSVVLASGRSGTTDLWAVRVNGGRPAGEPVRVKQNPASGQSLEPRGFSWAGVYYYLTRTMERNIYAVDLDPTTGRVLSTPARLNQGFVGSSLGPVAWSQDGASLAFARNIQSGATIAKRLVVKSLSDGAEREVLFTPPLPRNNFLFVRWTANDRSLLFDDAQYQQIVFRRVDRDTGAQEVVFDRTGGGRVFSHAALSGDGKSLYYSVASQTDPATPERVLVLFRRDMETGGERELYRTTSTAMGLRNLAISPDGQQLAFLVDDKDGSALRIVPADGGSHRDLLRMKTQLRPCVWTKDGRHLLVVEQDTKSGSRLLSVSTAGGDPVFTGLTMTELGSMSLHPNGRRLAFAGGATSEEIRMITNLLPNVK